MQRTLIVMMLVVALGAGAGCKKKDEETCTADDHRVAVTATFSGFDRSAARRLEIETRIAAAGTAAMGGISYLRRWTEVVHLDAAATSYVHRFDPGAWEVLDPELGVDRISIRFRVLGAEPERLLGEGGWAFDAGGWGCWSMAKVAVTATPTCEAKVEGEPCVGTDGPAVCRDAGGGVLACQASTCGDGFTDLRAGEICDPSQDGAGRLACGNCLPEPAVVTADDQAAYPEALIAQSHNGGGFLGTSSVPGYHALRPTDAATELEPVSQILIADVDGDGQEELIWANPGQSLRDPASVVQDRVGVVSVYDPIAGSSTLGSLNKAHLTLAGQPRQSQDPTGSWFGAAVAAGDVNGDGVVDLIVGAPLAESADRVRQDVGGVYLVLGGDTTQGQISPLTSTGAYEQVDPAGAPGSFQVISFRGENARDLSLSYSGGHLGYAVAAADLDGDGLADLALAEPGMKTGSSVLDHGGVYLVRGSRQFQAESGGSAVSMDTARFVRTTVAGARLGMTLATGDFDGDGYPDLAIGAAPLPGTPGFGGGVAVIFGGPDALAAALETSDAVLAPDPDMVFIPGGDGSLRGLGGQLAAADLDGDGRDELISTLGRPGSLVGSPSAVAILSGTALAAASRGGELVPGVGQVTVLEGPADVGFGLGLFGADVNGDHRRDLVIGAPGLDDPTGSRPGAGAVYVLYASPLARYFQSPAVDLSSPAAWTAGSPALPVVLLHGPTAGAALGLGLTTGDHFSFALSATQYAEWTNRRALTYLLAPGVPNNDGAPVGQISLVHFPGFFCCGAQCPCSPDIAY
jgi:hypothetical protein